jgi:hypothetical protein
MEMTKAALNGINVASSGISSGTYIDNNPWQMKDGYGNTESLNWLL